MHEFQSGGKYLDENQVGGPEACSEVVDAHTAGDFGWLSRAVHAGARHSYRWEMEAREDYEGPRLLSRWSACEGWCLGSGLVVCGFPLGGFYDRF